jgi:hypothetical protein
MTNQSRLAEKQVRRIRAMYSSQAGIVQAYDQLFNNNLPVTPNLSINDQTVVIDDSALPALTARVNFSLPLP